MGWAGIVWVALIAVLFMLPEVGFSTINHDNFNYAPIAVGVVLVFAGTYWLLSARHWFTGPRSQGSRTIWSGSRRSSRTSSKSSKRSTEPAVRSAPGPARPDPAARPGSVRQALRRMTASSGPS